MITTDVLIAGGGTAGALAAIASARRGAKTLLVEREHCLGGTATYGIPFLGPLTGSGDYTFTGLANELVDRLAREGFSPGVVDGATWNTSITKTPYQFALVPFDPEGLKYVLQEMALEAGVTILYYTEITGACVQNGTVRSVDLWNTAGKETCRAKVFCDCTGNAVLSDLCGAQFLPKQTRQNSSILFTLGNVDLERFLKAFRQEDHVEGFRDWHTRILMREKDTGSGPSLVHAAGHLRPFEDPGRKLTFTMVSGRDGIVFLNATRQTGIEAEDPWQVTAGEIAERRHVTETFRAMKENVPGFENCVLLSTSPLGIREGRNILGDYVITKDDVLSGRKFEDGIASGAYPIDIHDPKGGRTQFTFIREGGSYTVPYRALLPKGIEGLLTAGKHISADQNALGTVRIMGCVLMQGEAAGTAAALAVQKGCTPRELPAQELRQALGL